MRKRPCAGRHEVGRVQAPQGRRIAHAHVLPASSETQPRKLFTRCLNLRLQGIVPLMSTTDKRAEATRSLRDGVVEQVPRRGMAHRAHERRSATDRPLLAHDSVSRWGSLSGSSCEMPSSCRLHVVLRHLGHAPRRVGRSRSRIRSSVALLGRKKEAQVRACLAHRCERRAFRT